MNRLFDCTGFVPKGDCGDSWTTSLILLSQSSNFLIVIGYFSLSFQIYLYYLYKNNTLPNRPAFLIFMIFPLFCGLSRINQILAFWWSPYRFYITVDFLCAVSLILLSYKFRFLITYLLNLEEFKEQTRLNQELSNIVKQRDSSINRVVADNQKLSVAVDRLHNIIQSEMWVHDKRTLIKELEDILSQFR